VTTGETGQTLWSRGGSALLPICLWDRARLRRGLAQVGRPARWPARADPARCARGLASGESGPHRGGDRWVGQWGADFRHQGRGLSRGAGVEHRDCKARTGHNDVQGGQDRCPDAWVWRGPRRSWRRFSQRRSPAASGTDILWCGQVRVRGLVRRVAGLRCPDSLMRRRQWVSVWLVQGMQSRLPAPRCAVSLPVVIQS
jgi:hypothetical protein